MVLAANSILSCNCARSWLSSLQAASTWRDSSARRSYASRRSCPSQNITIHLTYTDSVMVFTPCLILPALLSLKQQHVSLIKLLAYRSNKHTYTPSKPSQIFVSVMLAVNFQTSRFLYSTSSVRLEQLKIMNLTGSPIRSKACWSILKASSAPGCWFLSGCTKKACRLQYLFISSSVHVTLTPSILKKDRLIVFQLSFDHF